MSKRTRGTPVTLRLVRRRTSAATSARPAWSHVWLVGLCAAATGAAVAIALARAPVPPTIDNALAVDSVNVTQVEFVDTRTVEVQLIEQPGSGLLAPRAGRITASNCTVGGAIESGASTVSIDGSVILNLATATPPWRDLRYGSRGDDVRALQQELVRLGFLDHADGVVGWATLRAFSRAMEHAGGTAPSGVIPAERIAWLQQTGSSAQSCPSLGGFAQYGESLVSFPARFTAATVVRTPDGLAPGDRVLLVDGETVALNDELRVTDPESLVRIAESDQFEQMSRSEQPGPLRLQMSLAEPLTASVVPPSSIFGTQGSAGCVIESGEVREVDLVGSELGTTLVTFPAGEPARTVQVHPDKSLSCR